MIGEMSTTRDERINAALAHGGIVLSFFSRGMLGIVLAVLIWITQRNKSKFAARQAAQAVAFQLVGLLTTALAWLVWAVLFAGAIMAPVAINPNRPEPMMPYTMIPALLLLAVPLCIMLGWVAYGVYAAAQASKGKDFSYPVIGRLIT